MVETEEEITNYVLMHIPELAGISVRLVTLSREMEESQREMGRFVGREVLASRLKGESDVRSLMEELGMLFAKINFSEGEIAEPASSEVLFRLCGCESVVEVSPPNVGRSLCAFDSGMIEGVLSAKLRGSFRVEERKCLGRGNEFCEFKISNR